MNITLQAVGVERGRHAVYIAPKAQGVTALGLLRRIARDLHGAPVAIPRRRGVSHGVVNLSRGMRLVIDSTGFEAGWLVVPVCEPWPDSVSEDLCTFLRAAERLGPGEVYEETLFVRADGDRLCSSVDDCSEGA